VRQQLAGQLAPYRAHLAEARWTHPRSWHLTLLFLGQVRSDRLPELQALVDEVAAVVTPYHVRADEGGGRPHRGEGVGWLELSRGAGSLIELATVLAERCPPAVTAGPSPRRTPSAHLTLARKAGHATIDALHRQVYGPLDVAWRVDRICLLRSHLDAAGARYETLHEATM
jgi:RNA 2',3'-cyclic 3'-phosphodiesterase